MSKAFNLTAQLNLAGPNNLKPIVSKIKKEIGSIKADVKFSIDPRAAKSVDAVKSRLSAMNSVIVSAKNNTNDLNLSLRSLANSLTMVKGGTSQVGTSMKDVAKNASVAAKSLNVASSGMEEFGKQSYLAIKRFAAFSVVTSAIYGLVNAVSSGVKSFLEFDRQLVRLGQVTGDGAVALSGLSKEITNLASTLGVSSEKLTEVAVTLAQAGLSAKETEQALRALAKTELAPSFDNLTDTTEGAIAAMRQFGIATKDLEGALGSINAVAAGFAVESSDLITAIQRAGGAFAASSTGVSEGTDALNEFIAVFTSVRATTRESAETIATGLRTIFTRIQRPKTIEFLKEFGVELTDLDGKFVGPYEAIKRLSSELNKIDPRDSRFAQIVEELGGFRQISKVIPLIQQFSEAEKALGVAQRGSTSLSEAQVTAQKSLVVQLAKVREQFLGLIKTVGQSDTFQSFFKIVLGLSSALIKLAGAFRPILPALAVLGAIKGGKAVTEFAGGFLGSFKKGGGAKSVGVNLGSSLTGSKDRETGETTSKASESLRSNTSALTALTKSVEQLNTTINNRGGGSTLNSGGKVLAFARGGSVPGTGNRDTVPAMLQPGEFVLRKKAVETLGAHNLQHINKYAGGGKALGARSRVKELDESELAQLSTADLIAYAKKQARDIFSTGGAGMAMRSEFIEVPPERIIPELDSDLTTYMGKRGFWKEIVAPFGRPKKVSAKQKSKLGREDALQAQISRQADEVAAREQQWTNIKAGSIIDNYLLSQLKDPVLTDYKTVRSGGSLPKAFHNTRLRKAVNEALENYDDFDYSGANLDKLISSFAAKKFASGGQVQKFAIGGSVEEQIKQNMKGRDNTYQFGIAALKAGNKTGYSRYESFPLSKDDPDSPMIGLHIGTLGDAIKNPKLAEEIEEQLTKKLQDSIINTASIISQNIPGTELVPSKLQDKILDGSVLSSAVGNIFESALNMIGAPFLSKIEKAKSIDFPLGLGPLAGSFFGDPALANIPTDATRTFGGSGKGISDFKGQIGRFFKAIQNKEFTKAEEKKNLESVNTEFRTSSSGQLLDSILEAWQGTGVSKKLSEVQQKYTDLKASVGAPRAFLSNKGTFQKFIESGKLEPVQKTELLKDVAGALGVSDIQERNLGGIISKFAFGGRASGGSIEDTVPALLTPGEFVINKKAAKRIGYAKLNNMNKADKLQGYNTGGSVGYIQKFGIGGAASPSPTDPRILAAFQDAAERAGMALKSFEKQLKAETLTKALNKVEERKTTRKDLKTDIVRTISKGLGDKESKKAFVGRLQGRLSELNPSASKTDINKAIGEIFKSVKSGKTLDDILKSTTTTLKPLQDAFDSTKDKTEALTQIQDELINEFGGLTDAVKATIDDLDAADYKKSGQAQNDFGLLGDFFPAIGLQVKKSLAGSKLLDMGGKFQNFGIKGLDEALSKISGPLGDAVKAIGGIPGVITAGMSMLGDSLKENDFFGDSVTGAGVAGAISGAGSQGLALGTLGQQLAGPIGGMIGTIGGAVAGAIEGFLKGAQVKQLENSMSNLNEGIDVANKALDNLSKYDNDANYKAALKAVSGLQNNINDLSYQAQSTIGEKTLSGAAGAASGLAYGAAAGGFAATAAATTGLTALATSITGLSAVVLSGGTIAIAAGITALGYGIYKFTQGTKDLDKEALQGQLKAVENYVKGISQLADRRIKSLSLDEITNNIKAFEAAAKDPAKKQALGEKTKYIEEAQRGELINAGYSIKSTDSVADFINANGGSGVAEQAKRNAAINLATTEVNQKYAGNTTAIQKELADQEKLYRRGLELAAEQEHQANLQSRMAASLRETNLQIESIIEIFDKMISTTERFNTEMEASQNRINEMAEVLNGNFKVGSVSRKNEDVLKNSRAYSDTEFGDVLSQVNSLAGGGENARKLTDSLQGKRIIEQSLPGILRGTSKENVDSVIDQLDDLFNKAGVSGNAKETLLNEVQQSLANEQTSRQGKSFDELAQEFPHLQAAMKTFEAAEKASTEILKSANDSLTNYGQNLDKINDAMQKSLELTVKGDEIRLESAMMLDEIYGRRSSITKADINDNKIKQLSNAGGAGGSLDPATIGSKLTEVTKKIEENRKSQQTASIDESRKLMEEEAALGRQANNLNKALEELANNSERTAQIMNDFQEYKNVRSGSQDFLERAFTADPEERLQIKKELDSYNLARNAIQSNNTEQIQQAAAADPEFYKNLFAGLRQMQGVMSPEEYESRRLEISRGLASTIPGLENMTAGKVGGKNQTWQDLLSEKMSKAFADRLKEAEKERTAALAKLDEQQKTNIENYQRQNDGLIQALSDLTKQLESITGIPAPTSGTTAGVAATAAAAGVTSQTELAPDRAANPVIVGNFQDRLQKVYNQRYLLAQKSSGKLNPLDEDNYNALVAELDKIKKDYEETFGSLPSMGNSWDQGQMALSEDLMKRAKAAREGTGPKVYTTIPSTSPSPLDSVEQEQQRLLQEYVNTFRQRSTASTPNGTPPAPAKPSTVETTSVAPTQQTANGGFGLLRIDENTKAFLTQFQASMDSFGSYVKRMEDLAKTLPSIPGRIEMQGRHTVQVSITGDKVWATLEGKMLQLVQGEVDKKMQALWNRTGGEMGSSGAGGSRVAGRFDAQHMP